MHSPSWIALALFLIGCDTPGTGRSSLDADRSDSMNEGLGGADPARALAGCLVDVPCAGNVDCPPGSRCNLELDAPECQTIACGPAGAPCSENALCSSSFTCEPYLVDDYTLFSDLRWPTDGRCIGVTYSPNLEVDQAVIIRAMETWIDAHCTALCLEGPTVSMEPYRGGGLRMHLRAPDDDGVGATAPIVDESAGTIAFRQTSVVSNDAKGVGRAIGTLLEFMAGPPDSVVRNGTASEPTAADRHALCALYPHPVCHP